MITFNQEVNKSGNFNEVKIMQTLENLAGRAEWNLENASNLHENAMELETIWNRFNCKLDALFVAWISKVRLRVG